MEKLKKAIQLNIENRTLCRRTECLHFAMGWLRGAGKVSVPIDLIEWIDEKYYNGELSE